MSSLKMFLIRGSRILDQMNSLTEASTYRTLRDNLKFLTTKKRQLATDPVMIQSSTTVPLVSAKMLEIKSIAISNGERYNVTIQFEGVQYEEVDTQQNVTFTGPDNEDYHIKHIELKRKNVKVRCDCLDFYHRFAAHNTRDKSLYGTPPPPYTPKTDRPSDNPRQVPGVCKHIIKTVESLKQSGLVH